MELFNHIVTLLPFLVHLFWALYLVIDIRQRDRAQKLLFIYMVVGTGLFFCHAIYYSSSSYPLFTISDCFYFHFSTSIYPVFYLYVSRLTDERHLSFMQVLLLFGPAFSLMVYSLVGYFLGWERVRGDNLAGVIRIVQVVPIAFGTYRKLSEYDTNVRNFYASIDDKTVKGTLIISSLFFVAIICTIILSLIGREWFWGNAILAIPSLFFSILCFSLGYIGSHYTFQVEQFSQDMGNEGVGQSEYGRDLYQTIVDTMQREKLFLQQGLKITDVAFAVGSNRTYVSMAINKYDKKTFSDFVNHFRIEYAKKLLQTKSYSMIEVATMSGFYSEESFRRNFKNETSSVPSQWTEEHILQ